MSIFQCLRTLVAKPNRLGNRLFLANMTCRCECFGDRQTGDCHPGASCRFSLVQSRHRGGRPKVPLEIRQLIRAMSLANPLWGALRIHGELLKLGIEIGQTSVAKYMARHRKPPSQGWKTFIRNHADGIASMDLFVVPTLSFRLLYGLLILRHGRRQILWLGVTAHPSAEWMARQLTEACGWEWNPRYATSSAIATGSMARFSPSGFVPWAFATGQPRHARHGRMAIRNG